MEPTLILLLGVLVCFAEQSQMCGNKFCRQTYIDKNTSKGDVSRLECEIPYDNASMISWTKGYVSSLQYCSKPNCTITCNCVKGQCSSPTDTRYECSVNASSAKSSITISEMKRTVDSGLWTTCNTVKNTCRSRMFIVYTFAEKIISIVTYADLRKESLVFISPEKYCQINVTMGCLYPTPVRVAVYFKQDKSNIETFLVSSDSDTIDNMDPKCRDSFYEKGQYAVINIRRENFKEMAYDGVKGNISIKLNMSCNMTDTPDHRFTYSVIFSGSKCKCWKNFYLILPVLIMAFAAFYIKDGIARLKDIIRSWRLKNIKEYIKNKGLKDVFNDIKEYRKNNVKFKRIIPRFLFVTLPTSLEVIIYIWHYEDTGFEPFCKCSDHEDTTLNYGVWFGILLLALYETALKECVERQLCERKRERVPQDPPEDS